MRTHPTIRLGYAVGTGKPVDVPIAHTIVTGQTQQSGKTTTLRAMVSRSGKRGIAFATKRGEVMPGRAIAPYLPREGDAPIHWRLVESVISSVLDESAGRSQRLMIVRSSKDARSLQDVRRNVERLRAKSKGRAADEYELVGEYLDLVLPDMKALRASDRLDLRPGMNVMDLTKAGPQMQALVIGATLDRLNHHEHDTLTVIPEAWEFVPNGRNAPAKDAAIFMARKGAAPEVQNFLYCDSQDIAGVDTVVRGAASVWVIGVQREANELKRTLDVVASSVSKAPKSVDVATLGIGQFFACWGANAVKTYVQPEGMSDEEARERAASGSTAPYTPPIVIRTPVPAALPVEPEPIRVELPAPVAPAVDVVPDENEDDMSAAVESKLDKLIDLMTRKATGEAIATPTRKPPELQSGPIVNARIARGDERLTDDEEQVYQRFKARLLADGIGTGGVTFTVTPPEKLRKDFHREEADRILATAKTFKPLACRVFKLLLTTSDHVGQAAIAARFGRPNSGNSHATLAQAINELAAAGFTDRKDKVGSRVVLRDKIAADLAFYKATDAEIDAVYQNVVTTIATQAGE